MSRKPYPTDLNDAQWQALQEHLPKATNGTLVGVTPERLRRMQEAKHRFGGEVEAEPEQTRKK